MTEKSIKKLLILKLVMFSVIIVYSALNLYFDSAVFFEIIRQGDSVVFDSFNFFYQSTLLPFNGILVFISLVLTVIILKNEQEKRIQAILPIALILVNFALNVHFSSRIKRHSNIQHFFYQGLFDSVNLIFFLPIFYIFSIDKI